MVRVALIHTVKSVLNTFGDEVKSAIEGVKVINTLDEYLALDPAERGEFTVNNKNRLLNIIKCAEMTEPDVIMVTCSTLSPAVEEIRPFVKVPLITIDGAMLKEAVKKGTKITVLATADSTVGPTTSGLRREAEKLGKKIDINVMVCPDAYDAIRALDKETHDEILKRKAIEIRQQDVVVLAQASMAHLEETIGKICGCTVLSSPKRCINELKEIVEAKR